MIIMVRLLDFQVFVSDKRDGTIIYEQQGQSKRGFGEKGQTYGDKYLQSWGWK
jgi:hypothetical protein